MLAAGNSPTTLSGAGSESKHLATVWWIMFGLAVGVYLVVGGLIIVASVRGRRRGAVEGPRRLDDYFIWIGGLGVPVADPLVHRVPHRPHGRRVACTVEGRASRSTSRASSGGGPSPTPARRW